MIFQSFKSFYRIILVIFLRNADGLIQSSQHLGYAGDILGYQPVEDEEKEWHKWGRTGRPKILMWNGLAQERQ